MDKKLYVFRGSPASGKGTLVPEFAKLLPSPVALLEQDKLRWGIHLIGRTVSEVSADEHAFATENLMMLLESYLRQATYTVVLEGLFTWDDPTSPEGSMAQILELAHRYGYETVPIVLLAEYQTLANRNERRDYVVPHDEFKSLYNAVYGTIDASEHQIDTTHLTVEESLAKIRELL